VERYKREHDGYALAGLGIDRQANTYVVTAFSYSLELAANTNQRSPPA
jgi:hypothetical protein